MKKILVVLLTVFSLFAVSTTLVKAESANIVTFGDFEGMLNDGEDVVLGEGGAMKNGYGSGAWDSAVTITKDPLNAENTVCKFSYVTDGKPFSSFFKFCTVEAGATYTISLKYLVVGQTVNFGMRFAPIAVSGDVLNVFYNGAATDGWQEANFELTPKADASYDSIGFWFDTLSSADNVGYVDDIVIAKKVEGGETPEEPVGPTDPNAIVTYGDFEGMLNNGEDVVLGEGSAMKNGYGSLGWDSAATMTVDPLNAGNTVCKFSYLTESKTFSSFFKFCTLSENTKYKIDLDYLVVGVTDNFGMRFAGAPALETTFYSGGATDGWQHASWEWTTEDDSSYDSIAIWFNTKGNADNVGYVDNVVVTKVEEVTPEPKPEIESPFDPSKTYYQSKTMTVNGDFEAFNVGTVLSEEQLEGAWGSLASYDNPAVIAEDNGSKVLKIGHGAKQYSSAFLMLPPELEEGDLVRLSYDIKLNLTANSYITINSAFTGITNPEYYRIEFSQFDLAEGVVVNTSGDEALHYPVKITAKENGWFNIELDFQLTRKDRLACDSLRFLFAKAAEGDYMLIDNVNIYLLSEEEFVYETEVESIEFNDGDSVSLTVGDNKTLAYTINPSDATDKSVTFESSNEAVATVDKDGKVVAVGKGACTITVTTANGVKDEIAVIVTAAPSQGGQGGSSAQKGCGGSVVASIFGVIALAGAALVLRKRKEQ